MGMKEPLLSPLPHQIQSAFSRFSSAAASKVLEERTLIPLPSASAPRLRQVAHDSGNEGPEALTLGCVLLDLHTEDLGRVHLLVQELHDALEFSEDVVGHEN